MSESPNPERKIMQLRLRKELYRRIGIAAVWYDRSRSGLIRDVLTSWLAKEDRTRADQGMKTSLQEAVVKPLKE